MKYQVLSFIVFLLAITACLSGCTEQRYYHENHHHSPEYSQHHPSMPPMNVEIEMHN